jgi:hypothetical protein
MGFRYVIKRQRLTLPKQSQPRGCDADRRQRPAPIYTLSRQNMRSIAFRLR